jgi:hypothetical protein
MNTVFKEKPGTIYPVSILGLRILPECNRVSPHARNSPHISGSRASHLPGTRYIGAQTAPRNHSLRAVYNKYVENIFGIIEGYTDPPFSVDYEPARPLCKEVNQCSTVISSYASPAGQPSPTIMLEGRPRAFKLSLPSCTSLSLSSPEPCSKWFSNPLESKK